VKKCPSHYLYKHKKGGKHQRIKNKAVTCVSCHKTGELAKNCISSLKGVLPYCCACTKSGHYATACVQDDIIDERIQKEDTAVCEEDDDGVDFFAYQGGPDLAKNNNKAAHFLVWKEGGKYQYKLIKNVGSDILFSMCQMPEFQYHNISLGKDGTVFLDNEIAVFKVMDECTLREWTHGSKADDTNLFRSMSTFHMRA
jgi:hypothetical protein